MRNYNAIKTLPNLLEKDEDFSKEAYNSIFDKKYY